MVDTQNPRRWAARVRALSFPVCTTLFTAFGYVLGLSAGRGKEAFLLPHWFKGALIGLALGIVVAAVTATTIDLTSRRR